MKDEEAIHSNWVMETVTDGNMENQHLPGRLGEKEMGVQGSIRVQCLWEKYMQSGMVGV